MYQNAVKILLMDMAERRARLRELRGNRTQDEIADSIGVTGTAVYSWERKGHVSRKHAQAYDDALGAGGEVLSMFGYAAQTGATVATLDAKLDEMLDLLRELAGIAKLQNDAGAAPGDQTPRSMRRPARP